MKKKILSLSLVAAMLISSTAAFAQDAQIQPISAVAISETEQAPQAQYIKSTYTIKNISEFSDDGIIIETEDENGGPVNITVFEDTLVYDNTGKEIKMKHLEEGMSITMFYYHMTPTIMIYPPQYTPSFLVVNTDEAGFVDVDLYGEDLVNSANSLAINFDKSIKIVDKNKKIKDAEDLQNKHLAVFYTTSTRSIPAQTTPSTVVILADREVVNDNEVVDDKTENESIGTVIDVTLSPEAEAALNDVAVMGDSTTVRDDAMLVTPENAQTLKVNGKTITVDFVSINGTTMLPVRAVAEALGLDVSWNAQTSSVQIGTVQMGAFLSVGKDEYSKARTMPQSLGQAPIIVETKEGNGLTFVPVSFFTEIVEAEVTQDANVMSITLK